MRIFFAACLLFQGFFFLAAEEKDYYGALKDINEENAVLAFVRAELKKAGASTVVKDFSGFTGGHSFSHILQTKVPGRSPETLIIAAPAVSGGSSFSAALSLSLWRESRQTPPPLNLLFLFLGGDGHGFIPGESGEDFSRKEALGTRLFLESFFSPYPVSVLYLDFTGLPAKILCETGTRGIIAPPQMLENAWISLEESGLPFLIEGSKNRIYRTGLAQSASPAGEYLAAGFPALGLRGEGRTGNGDYEAWGKAFHAFFRSYLKPGAEYLRGEWDQHYLFFHCGPAYRIIGERALLLTLFFVFGAGILYACFARARFMRYAKIFLRNIHTLPLIFFILVLFLMAGTALVRLTEVLRNTEALWQHQPFVFFILKTGFAAFLILLFLHQIRRLPLAKNGGFYSASAIFCFLINVFLFGAFDIAFVLFFLCPCAASALFSFFRRPMPGILLFLIALLPLGLPAYETFFLEEKALAGVLINSPLTGNLLLGLIFLPFLLMLIRVGLLCRRPRAAKSAQALRVCAGGVFLAALACALSFNPWGESGQPLIMEEYAEPAEPLRELRLSSPSPLGNFTLAFGGENFSVDTGRKSLTLPLEALKKRAARTISGGEFLGRKTYNILFTPSLKPERVTVNLSSDSPLLVYNCNFPYSLDIAGRRAEIFIGKAPPLPLKIVLTFSARQTVGVRITSWSPLVSGAGEIEGKTFTRTSYSKLVDSFIIKSDE